MSQAFAGLRGTGKWGEDERPTNFREMISFLNPNGSAPLTAILGKAASESVDDPQFSWWNERMDIIVLQEDGTGNDAIEETINVLSGANALAPNDLIMIDKAEDTVFDNEQVKVISVTSDTAFEGTRGAAGTTAAVIPAGSKLTKLATSYEEGSDKAPAKGRNPIKFTNYCQIMKTAIGNTFTNEKTYARTGKAWTNDKKRRMFDHSRDIEMQLLFGVPSEIAGTEHPIRTTGGLRYFFNTNVTIFSAPTEDDILDALTPLWDFEGDGSGDERIAFCGNGALNALNQIARSSPSTRINFDGTISNAYGMNLTRWVLPQGTIGLKSHPLLNRHPQYTNSMFVIDPTALKWRDLRDTRFQDNIQHKGEDKRVAQWLTEAGLEVLFDETSGYFGDLTYTPA